MVWWCKGVACEWGFWAAAQATTALVATSSKQGRPFTANIVDPWRPAAHHTQLPLLKLLASSHPPSHLTSLPRAAWRCARDADMARRLWDKSEELVQAALLKAGLA